MLKRIIKFTIIWRLLILAAAVAAVFILPVKDCCADFGSRLSLTYLTHIWANFAGRDFLELAKFGYGYPLEIGTYVFFPLFPALIRIFTLFTPDFLSAALVLSHLCLLLALYFFYLLIRLDYHDKVGRNALILLLVFPTAFFFGSVYTESFFLLIVVLSFYLARKGYFFLACLLGLLASATRVAGIFVWPALIYEIWQQKKFSPALIWLSLPPLGLFAYMKFLLTKTGDPLYFLKVSPDFGPNLLISKLILIHQVFFRYAKMVVFAKNLDITYISVLFELFCGILFLVLCLFAFKKLRRSYAVYFFLSYLIPTFTGTFSGVPKTALTFFPAFILLSLWFSNQKPVIQKIYLGANIVLSFVYIILFTRGYFVG